MTTDGSGNGPDDPGWIAELAAQRRGRSEMVPRGRPISSALILPPGVLPRDRQLRMVLAEIDAVHGDGELPPLSIRWGVLPLGLVALYRSTDDHLDTVSLTIHPNRTRWMLATVHEIGHFLDHQGIGEPSSFASLGDRLLREWQGAVERSRTLSMLRTFSRGTAAPYFERPEELWARSYAQWIALRSGNETLSRQVVELRGHDPADPALYLQWDDDDFEPIADSIDCLCRGLGWLR